MNEVSETRERLRIGLRVTLVLGMILAAVIFVSTYRIYGIRTPVTFPAAIAVAISIANSKRVPVIAAALGGALGGTAGLFLPTFIWSVHMSRLNAMFHMRAESLGFLAFFGGVAGFVVGICYGIHRITFVLFLLSGLFALMAIGCVVQHFVDPGAIWDRDRFRGVIEPSFWGASGVLLFLSGRFVFQRKYRLAAIMILQIVAVIALGYSLLSFVGG